MPKSACKRTDATSLRDDLPVIAHTQRVHVQRTHVNVDSVRTESDKAYMSEDESIGSSLSRLRMRAGLSMRHLAMSLGYASASGLQRYVDVDYDRALPVDLATRFADALEGRGSPPIQREEVIALTRFPAEPNAMVVQLEGAAQSRMKPDLPVFGTAMGSTVDIEGEAIEQTSLNQADVIQYVRRPPILEGRCDAYGLYVQGASMEPVHLEGDLIVAETKRPPRIGDDIVLYLRPAGEEDDGERARCVMIKRLVRRTAAFYELRQFNPDRVFKVPIAEVVRADRVFRLTDLIS